MYRAHTHEDQAHCLQRVWESSEMAPPSHVEFFRPHERMEGGGGGREALMWQRRNHQRKLQDDVSNHVKTIRMQEV